MVNDPPLPLADPPADAATESAIRSALAAPAATPGKSAAPPALPFKKKLQSAAASLIGATLIRVVGLTLRIRLRYGDTDHRGGHGPLILNPLRGPAGGPLLFALTHGSCFPILYTWRGRGLCVVTSRSTDGQILARVLGRLGYKTVHGSSSRGGTRALIDLARFVQNGGDAAIAVDGPRGPAEHVKPGIILLSKITGRPIIPLAATPKRFWRFQSWDRFRAPIPFTSAMIIGGQPMQVPPDADHELMEQMRVELENKLRALQAEADERMKVKVWCLKDRKKKR